MPSIFLLLQKAASRKRGPRAVGPLFTWEGNRWSAGPSTTPTVDGNLIFALGGMGDLVCAEADSGKELWRKNLPTDLDAEVNPIGGGPKKLGWGFTGSPLVDGEKLIVVPGGPQGTVAALNKQTGEVLWRSTEATDQAAYTSPMLAEFGGVRQYVVLTNQGLLGVDATMASCSGRFAGATRPKSSTRRRFAATWSMRPSAPARAAIWFA